MLQSLLSIWTLFSTFLITSFETQSTSWPHGPFHTHKSQVLNAKGQPVRLMGTNWPGHGESMIPEGLQYQSVEHIVGLFSQAGFNAIRHPYAIQMIDQGSNVTLQQAMTWALGIQNGTKIMHDIIRNNPTFTPETTRFDILSHVANVEEQHGILMHLDNHVSEAKWCCQDYDGNTWFGDTKFDIDKWHHGLEYMAKWSKRHANILSISLRNELRVPNRTLGYNWVNWWGNVSVAADKLHAANPDLLITISGLYNDVDLSALTAQTNLYTAPSFRIEPIDNAHSYDPIYARIQDLKPFKNRKIVLELHTYQMFEPYQPYINSCADIEQQMYRYGFNAMHIPPPDLCRQRGTDPADVSACPRPKLHLPVWLTEFGEFQSGDIVNNVLQTCLRDFTIKHGVSWMHWAIAGSYYTRLGTPDFDDTWGMSTHDWSAFRSQEAIDNFYKPWVKAMGKTNLEL